MQQQDLEILIVDDESDICYLLSNMLRRRGIHVHSVSTLREAKDFLLSHSPYAIFLDNHLPDGLGSEFLQYLKCIYPKIKIVIITGNRTVFNFPSKVPDGVTEVIFKPFTSERIYTVLDKIA